jgi:hypothetical protein
MKALLSLSTPALFATLLAGPLANAAVTLDCGSFMQDPIAIQLNAGQAVVTAPDLLTGRTRVLEYKGTDGVSASFAGDMNTARTGAPFYSSLVLKVPADLAKMSRGSKVELSLVERYSENLASPGVPHDWKPSCVVK